MARSSSGWASTCLRAPPASNHGSLGSASTEGRRSPYQIAAPRIAEALVGERNGILAAECFLVSQIGRPVADPQLADVRLLLREACRPADFAPQVAAIVERELARLACAWREILDGDVAMY